MRNHFIDFAKYVTRNSSDGRLKVVTRENNIWHRIIFNKSLAKFSISNIIQHIALKDPALVNDYHIISDECVYLSCNHIESYVPAFTVEHLSYFSSYEEYIDNYLDNHYQYTIDIAPLRFNDFNSANVMINPDLSWTNVDIDEYFAVRSMKPMWYFKENSRRVFATNVIHMADQEEYALAKFDEFYNDARLNDVQDFFGKRRCKAFLKS